MEDSSADSLKKEIHPPSQAELSKELYDPLVFMPIDSLRSLRKKRRLQSVAMISVAIGLPLFIYLFDKLLFPKGDHITGTQLSRNGMGALILAALLIYTGLRGLYNTMTIDRAIAFERRRGLLSMHPELQQVEIERQKQQKDSPWPKRIIWIIPMLPMAYTALFYLLLWLGLITTH